MGDVQNVLKDDGGTLSGERQVERTQDQQWSLGAVKKPGGCEDQEEHLKELPYGASAVQGSAVLPHLQEATNATSKRKLKAYHRENVGESEGPQSSLDP
eukprot:CAMPEP_0175808660 /NCGR_PEP_ID=MMETSP0107_2-20121207/2376_1 /TAXON_ID=195067 ORGANISM="Goniomonas pacifica, Strain CCMP1869" /NCGR_SAMPLE_ID=MMETSP0107_2 /ASSEMBLY_ACC=CAM_ASM_000203 /LENGTH=98 /DNA_ID=CAMNT_0017120299 /DNA_START=221 /DNA_END=517 /DNA_ORIENTATION=+